MVRLLVLNHLRGVEDKLSTTTFYLNIIHSNYIFFTAKVLEAETLKFCNVLGNISDQPRILRSFALHSSLKL